MTALSEIIEKADVDEGWKKDARTEFENLQSKIFDLEEARDEANRPRVETKTSLLESLIVEIEKHGVMRAHATLIQAAREELTGLRLLVKHHKEHHTDDPCICVRELVVTRADVNCPVHGLPSVRDDEVKEIRVIILPPIQF